MEYSEIINVFVREIESPDLLELEKDFYQKALRLADIKEKKGDEVSRYEASALRKTLEVLFLLRISKAIEIIKRGEKISTILPKEEQEVLSTVLSIIEKIRKESLGEQKREKRVRGGVLVAFTKSYGKLLLEEGGVMGPFTTGDLAFLPLHVAEELRRRGVVEVIAQF